MRVEQELGRREFLSRALMLGLAATGSGWLVGCKGRSAATLSCTDVSGLTDEERATREAQQYEEVSTTPDQFCRNCVQYQAPTETGACGTCTIVPGPVNPGGNCTSWVAMEQPA